jgi:hypothetical protein
MGSTSIDPSSTPAIATGPSDSAWAPNAQHNEIAATNVILSIVFLPCSTEHVSHIDRTEPAAPSVCLFTMRPLSSFER